MRRSLQTKALLAFSVFIQFMAVPALRAEESIREAPTMQSALIDVTPDSLVIFDLDNTVMRPTQTLGSDQWFDHLVMGYKKQGLKELEIKRLIMETWIKVQMKTPMIPVEADTPKTIRALQKDKVKVIALTARPAQLVDRTLEQLASKALDVDFSANGISDQNEIIKTLAGTGELKKGVLFSGIDVPKGYLLAAFLEKFKLRPKKIIFIDDKLKNLESVRGSMKAMNIPFFGRRYGAADPIVNAFNPRVVDLQWERFNANPAAPILTDEEAGRSLK